MKAKTNQTAKKEWAVSICDNGDFTFGYFIDRFFTKSDAELYASSINSELARHVSQETAQLLAEKDKLNQELQDEIAELKEAISELIQVKDWKDKYGKDEHYLKAMPIAWENARKLIQK